MSAAVIVMRQNRYMRRFADAGATSAGQARSLAELDLRDTWIFRRMVAAGVFRPAGEDRWYLDTAGAEQFRSHRQSKVLIVVVAALLVWLFFMLAQSAR